MCLLYKTKLVREITLQIYTNFMYTREKETERESLFTNVIFGDYGC